MRSECLNIKNYNALKNNVILFFVMLFFLAPNVYCQNKEDTKSARAVIERLIGNRAKDFDLKFYYTTNPKYSERELLVFLFSVD